MEYFQGSSQNSEEGISDTSIFGIHEIGMWPWPTAETKKIYPKYV